MKSGTSLEKDVRHIYSYLLNMRDEGVVVSNSVVMTGKSRVQHEIDVFYEFARVGIRHRVAIECKDWGRAVSKGQIQEFESKLRDIGNIIGVVISRNGYQSGAEVFAEYHDILALRFEDLPAIHVRLAERIRTVALPDESYVGEPFWIIMEVRDGKVTGSHYGMPFPGSDKVFIPLTLSKPHAERLFRAAHLDPQNWAIRGLPRFALRAFLVTLGLYEKRMNCGGALIYFPPPTGAPPDDRLMMLPVSREDLIREFYGEPIPSLEDVIKPLPIMDPASNNFGIGSSPTLSDFIHFFTIYPKQL